MTVTKTLENYGTRIRKVTIFRKVDKVEIYHGSLRNIPVCLLTRQVQARVSYPNCGLKDINLWI